MKRPLMIAALLLSNLVFAVVALGLPANAALLFQATPAVDEADAEPTPLAQPVHLRLQQNWPISLTVGGRGSALAQTVALSVDVDLHFSVTQTLTSTVVSSVTLKLAKGLPFVLPITFTVGDLPPALLLTTPLTPTLVPEEPTATPTNTATSTPTATPTLTPTTTAAVTPTITTPISPTATVTSGPTVIISSIAITANLRAGPGIDFAVVTQASPGQLVRVAAISADNQWYLLDTGQWVSINLVNNAPPNLPTATDELIAALLTPPPPLPTVASTVTVTATATPAAIPLPSPTPTPAAGPAPAVTVDANLRSGPGLEFPIIGGTITGQTINIVARNEAGDWFLLDNGGWVATFLVANPPTISAVPVFNPNAAAPAPIESPVITTTTTVTATAPLTSTAPATTTSAATSTVLGVEDNLYLVDANELIVRYERALGDIENLVSQAGQNDALLLDQSWLQSVSTAIALVRATNARVRTLQPTPQTQAIHGDLVQAAAAYDTAATLLSQAIDQREAARFDDTFVEITRGHTFIDSATDKLEALTP
jgi:uncharacterized protein YgiM (DUF1202 family)